MTDREQTRRDAKAAIKRFDAIREALDDEFPHLSDQEYVETQLPRDMRVVADAYLALLAELEQAEKEREERFTKQGAALAEATKLRLAIRHAIELRNHAFNNTPVRDDTEDAHFALEELRQVLHKALNAYNPETAVERWRTEDERHKEVT